jgi:hypothetical protein
MHVHQAAEGSVVSVITLVDPESHSSPTAEPSAGSILAESKLCGLDSRTVFGRSLEKLFKRGKSRVSRADSSWRVEYLHHNLTCVYSNNFFGSPGYE